LANESVTLDGVVEREKGDEHQAPASNALSAAGRPVRKTSGSAPAVIVGTVSRREAFVLPASTNGLRLNASLAADGRRIRTGTLAEKR